MHQLGPARDVRNSTDGLLPLREAHGAGRSSSTLHRDVDPVGQPADLLRPAAGAGEAAAARGLGLAPDQHVYFCAQTLLKVHPDFDALVATILRRDPAGVAVFVAGRYSDRAEVLRQRWQQTLPDVNDRLIVLANLNEHDYLSLMCAADVSLDTLHFCGANTTYDAMAAGTPVVTLPGTWQRARYTLAVYQQMNILDCIAESADHYIELALRLTAEPEWRRELSRRIVNASPVLFNQQSPAAELADCFEHLLGMADDARSGGSRR